MIGQKNIKDRKIYFLITPTAVKVRTKKAFFWKTREVDYPSRTFRTPKFGKIPVRPALLWSLVNSKIDDMIKNCPTYLTFRYRQSNEPAIQAHSSTKTLGQNCTKW